MTCPHRLLRIAAAVLVCAGVVEAELDSLAYTCDSLTIACGLYTPEQPPPSRGFPLVLALHGASERGSDLRHLHANCIDRWFAPDNQASRPSYVLLPQCPSHDSWVTVPSWWRTRYSIDSISRSASLGTVTSLLDSLIDALPIDTNRVYVTGFSMGGYGTWDMILRHPHRFAAAVPVCGVGDPGHACRAAHLPIWVCHCSDDDIIPVDASRTMVSALEACGRSPVYTHCTAEGCAAPAHDTLARLIDNGADLLYSEYDGGGHFAWVPAYNDVLLMRWLFEQRRDGDVAVAARRTAPRYGDRSAVRSLRVDLRGRRRRRVGPRAAGVALTPPGVSAIRLSPQRTQQP